MSSLRGGGLDASVREALVIRGIKYRRNYELSNTQSGGTPSQKMMLQRVQMRSSGFNVCLFCSILALKADDRNKNVLYYLQRYWKEIKVLWKVCDLQ
jgi:hypothetical protein